MRAAFDGQRASAFAVACSGINETISSTIRLVAFGIASVIVAARSDA